MSSEMTPAPFRSPLRGNREDLYDALRFGIIMANNLIIYYSRRGERPELKEYLDSVADYDNIFVCGPCWWGTLPCALLGTVQK